MSKAELRRRRKGFFALLMAVLMLVTFLPAATWAAVDYQNDKIIPSLVLFGGGDTLTLVGEEIGGYQENLKDHLEVYYKENGTTTKGDILEWGFDTSGGYSRHMVLDGKWKITSYSYDSAGAIKSYTLEPEEVASHKVTYNAARFGGTTTATDASVPEYRAIDLTPTAGKGGWDFVGWNTDPTATTKLTRLLMGDQDVTLYAIFKKNLIATFYSGNNQKETQKFTIYNQAQGREITAPALKEKSGWTAVGWNASENAYTGEYSVSQKITLTGRYLLLRRLQQGRHHKL